MNTIIIATGAVTVIGLLCAVILSIASKVMTIAVDEREAQIREVLPGANCGACGFAGCDGYAAALVGGDTKTNLCVPGGDAVSLEISGVLGVEFEDVTERIAIVRCGGARGVANEKMEYNGVKTCAAAKLLFGGASACAFGCIGYGDCEAVCPNGAICVDDGVARVNARLCTGCGLCAKTCPNKLIVTEPDTVAVVVACRNNEKGGAARKKCAHACIGCKKCERECPSGAITVTDNLAQIDYDKCTNCGHCVEACTVKCIEYTRKRAAVS
ncbi:MAG: RnfABCDGE type electron transport complex subunit B [Oscillospiraceae bacterium]|jgi:Na+-translocating ferredoxin:NAD+ oxidoreductase RNF subunit RnfB|nr:RnfABCDGE type electron transport complex subunit B [Oscillospiraceae bacterium]